MHTHAQFLGATVHQIRLDKDELTYKAFRHFDRDRSGFISKEELRAALGQHPDAGELRELRLGCAELRLGCAVLS
jgi:Ca2+-binding EF-hand superfamily protein